MFSGKDSRSKYPILFVCFQGKIWDPSILSSVYVFRERFEIQVSYPLLCFQGKIWDPSIQSSLYVFRERFQILVSSPLCMFSGKDLRSKYQILCVFLGKDSRSKYPILCVCFQGRAPFPDQGSPTTWRHPTNHHHESGGVAQRLGTFARFRLQPADRKRHGTIVSRLAHVTRVAWHAPVPACQSHVTGQSENTHVSAGDSRGG